MQAGNDKFAVSATVYCTREDVKEQLGSDLGGYFILVKVDLSPKGKLAVSRDDFLLRSYKDGQKSQPFEPSQITGSATMVVSSTNEGGGAGTNGGPSFGVGPMWFPGGGIGNGTANTSSAEAKIDTNASAKENPLLSVLKAKILPEKQTTDPLSGLLYFSLEGKYKAKDLVLQYNGPAGRLQLEFKP